jgi:acetylornithine deacetylase
MNDMAINELFEDSLFLLKKLIQTPSLSRDEESAANIIRAFLTEKEIPYSQILNNTWCKNKYWDETKPVILLNSHIDTVKPVDGWLSNPFDAIEDGDKLTGLGSNDAGGPLVSLLALFRYYYQKENLPFNLIYSATAEEECSGTQGAELLVKQLERVDFAIVGEPTLMKLAIAEKGLIVLDCVAKGKAGHAARNEGINSIYLALEEINKIRNYSFERKSPLLGEVKMTVTQIEAGFQHNVVPDTCRFVVDVRTNELYSNDEIIDLVSNHLLCDVKPRSRRLNSSGLDVDHPFVKRAVELGVECYGSPTMSDQSLMPYKSIKIGPGDSARSHTANEYILKSEIKAGIELYIKLLKNLVL